MTDTQKQGRKEFFGRPFLVEGTIKQVGFYTKLLVLVSDLNNKVDYNNTADMLKISDSAFALAAVDNNEFILKELTHPTTKERAYEFTFTNEKTLMTICTKVAYSSLVEETLSLRDRQITARLEELESRSSPQLVARLVTAEGQLVAIRSELDAAKATIVDHETRISRVEPRLATPLVYGTVNSDATVSRGTGDFSVVRNTTGVYTVTFNVEFDEPPVITTSREHTTNQYDYYAHPLNIEKKTFIMHTGYYYSTSNAYVADNEFSFVAIGKKV